MDIEAGIIERVDFGTAQLRPDRRRRGGWTLVVDGVEQSYVSLDDPSHVSFAYMRRLAAIVDCAGPSGAPLRVLHLGGGALTLPRYVAATRPGSAQLVVERDAALHALVMRVLPLPDGVDVEVSIGDARAAVESLPGRRFDLVVADVYQAARMPATVASVQFGEHVTRILDRDGIYAVNVTELPTLVLGRVQAATLAAVFADVCLIAEPRMLRGRRYGNVVLAASPEPAALPMACLRRTMDRADILHGDALDDFVGATGPLHDDRRHDDRRHDD